MSCSTYCDVVRGLGEREDGAEAEEEEPKGWPLLGKGKGFGQVGENFGDARRYGGSMAAVWRRTERAPALCAREESWPGMRARYHLFRRLIPLPLFPGLSVAGREGLTHLQRASLFGGGFAFFIKASSEGRVCSWFIFARLAA